jgi:hypothetical protein
VTKSIHNAQTACGHCNGNFEGLLQGCHNTVEFAGFSDPIEPATRLCKRAESALTFPAQQYFWCELREWCPGFVVRAIDFKSGRGVAEVRGRSVQVMETWRQQLIGSLARELEDSDDEFQDQLAVDLVTQVGRVFTAPAAKRGRGGSHFGRKFVDRDRGAAHERLVADYFGPQPLYDGNTFRRRYRMRRELFLRIVSSVCEFDSYFVQSSDAVGQLGLSSLQKCTAAMRMLAYGAAADATDEYCRLGESTALESMKRFVNAIRGCFEAEYLRAPMRADLEKQVAINSARGFPGMFGSLDCMHWDWEKCPTAW